VNSRTTERFRKALDALPAEIQVKAHEAYETFRRDSSHPSLRFKQVHPTRPIFSVRITRGYRALAVWNVDGDEDLVWFWIGSHAEYDRLLRQL
jgi:hypothetical protein